MHSINLSVWNPNIDDCFSWINNINNTFFVNSLDIYLNNSLNVNIKDNFIPWKVLILLCYHLDILNQENKDISLSSPKKVKDFLENSWAINFIEYQKIDYNNLLSSVIIPFCKVSNIESFTEVILFLEKKLTKNIYSDISYLISELHNNSMVHWKTNNIYMMWQYYPKNNKYDISIYDDWEWIIANNEKKKIVDEVLKIKNYVDYNYKEKIEKKFWFDLFFIILCVTTKFSTKWIYNWWLWLLDLSKFLLEDNWHINIATGETFVNLKFKEECDILKEESIIIDYKKLDYNIKWTYISFTFSQYKLWKI